MNDLRIRTNTAVIRDARVAVSINGLNVPDDLRVWCRKNGIIIGLDAFMRHCFQGPKSTVEKLINERLAPNDEERRQELLRSVIEA